jgi:hypothetical protein
MTPKSRVKKVRPTPKKSIAVSHEEDHPAALVDGSGSFARMNGRIRSDPLKETFEVSNRYLELAALVLGPEEEEKAHSAKSKKSKTS